VRLHNTTVFLERHATLGLGGGTGPLEWSSPTAGPFSALALWSESVNGHSFSGQAGLALEGIFFAPNGPVSYQGNGTQQQTEAQFIVHTISAGGNGTLILAPRYDRAVQFPNNAPPELIR
jgi:hypothetical protein